MTLPSSSSGRTCDRRCVLAVLVLLGGVAVRSAQGAGAETPATAARSTLETTYKEQIFPLLTTYCIKCHGPEKHKGDLNFQSLEKVATALTTLTVWRDCAGKILLRDMPPDQETRQPSDAERDALLAWINGLKRLAPKDPGPGVIRRLSRAEYANTLHDLLGVDPKVAADLPADSVGEGFNSTISPLLMERYLEVADEILDQIIKPDQMTVKWNAGQLDAVIERKPDPGKPEGAERRFTGAAQLIAIIPAPVEGSYSLRIRAAGEITGTKEGPRLEVRADDQIVGEIKVAAAKSPANYPLTLKLPAGRVRLTVQLANPLVGETAAPEKGKAAAAAPAVPALRAVTIHALEVDGPPATAPSEAQRRLFVALPGKDLDKRTAARCIVEAFAKRAYRRPPRAKEIDQLVKVFDLADGQGEVFSDAIKLMLKAVLVSPQFLFFTPDEETPAGGPIVAIGGYQLAARLSYLLWSSMPDDELIALAENGRLRDPAVISQQVRRMVLDARAHALFDSFGAPWLGLDKLEEQAFDEKKFPLMGKDMRKAMYAEAAMLFDSVLREDLSIMTFLDCDYTFLNEKLAKIYGLDEVKGSAMRKVQLSDGNRGGILTMPGVLAVSSLPNRTSPVKRGIWVLTQVLGQNLPPAPMNVPPLEKQDTHENAGLNLRQRTELHRSDPVCASCHRVLDPIGFGLENFDAIGRWRERDDTGGRVDPVGELPGKISFRSPQDLKRLIAGRKDDFCHALVAKVLGYALCRHLDGYDEVVVDEISAAVAKDGYRLQSILVRVATSYLFLNRHLNH